MIDFPAARYGDNPVSCRNGNAPATSLANFKWSPFICLIQFQRKIIFCLNCFGSSWIAPATRTRTAQSSKWNTAAAVVALLFLSVEHFKYSARHFRCAAERTERDERVSKAKQKPLAMKYDFISKEHSGDRNIFRIAKKNKILESEKSLFLPLSPPTPARAQMESKYK